MAAAAAAAAPDFDATDRLIEAILGPDGKLHTLGEHITTGTAILRDLTGNVNETLEMIADLQDRQRRAAMGQAEAGAAIVAAQRTGDAELHTLRQELQRTEQVAAEAERRTRAAQNELEEARAAQQQAATGADRAAAEAAEEAATRVAAATEASWEVAEGDRALAERRLRAANEATQEQLRELQQR